MSQHRLEDFLSYLSREAAAEELMAVDEDLLARASILSQELMVDEARGGPGSEIAGRVIEYYTALVDSLLELRLSKASGRISERGVAPNTSLPEEGLVNGLLERAIRTGGLLESAVRNGSPLVLYAARWEASRDMAALLIRQDVPAFRGVDLNSYGPFSSGDVAMVPREDARSLVAKGHADEVVVLG